MLKSKKQKLTELLRPIVKQILTEASRDGYSITYYATVGEHGDTGKLYPDFKSALQAAITFSKDTDRMEGLEYLGVEPMGNAKEFSVLYCTKEYLEDIADSFGYNNPSNKKIWRAVALKVARAQERTGGKQVIPQNGKFN